MMRVRFFALAAVAAILPACGGGSSTPSTPTPTPVPTTQTFTGSTIQTPTTCTGDSHDFIAAEGPISVQLIETSDPAGALSVQVCAGGIDTGNCSIRQQKINVGQTISGSRIGIATQNLKLLGHNCVFGGPAAAAPITYRATVTFQR